MLNLVQNQHGTYTFRKRFTQGTVRLSLLTRDEIEAKQIYFKIQGTLLSYPDLEAREVRLLIKTLLDESRQSTRFESRKRLQAFLSSELNPAQALPIYELLNKYKAEKVRSGSWSSNTIKLSEDHIRVLIELVGDVPVHQINSTEARLIKEKLQRIPAHAKKKKAYRDLTLRELSSMDIPQTHLMSVTTINMKLSFYSEAFNWAQVNGLSESNPFKGMQIKDRRHVQSLRSPFTIAELNRVFAAPRIRDAKALHRFWLPVLALYTGARINELCQLYLEDIAIIEGCWCLRVTDERSDQSLKTPGSKRIIPLHSDLLDLGFISMVDRLKQKRVGRLFVELKLDDQKYSREASKWFSRIKRLILPESDSKKCFHSFRHCFTDNLVNTEGLGSDPAIKALLGHQNKDITTGLYGGGVGVLRLKETVECLSWKRLGVGIAPGALTTT